jgi:HlyD family secretion protein
VALVERGPLQAKVVETGTLEPARTIDIKSQFSGEIRQVRVMANQRVSANQPLVVIQQESSQARQAAQLRTSIDEEQVNFELARLELDRMKALYERDFVAQKELQIAEQHYQQAMLRLDLAKRQLLLALGGNRELYHRYLMRGRQSDGLEEFIVRSPSEGTIIELKIHPGELITSGTFSYGGGTVLMRLADLKHMVVKAKVNEVNIARVNVGQAVEIRLDAIPGLLFHGEVVSIAAGGEKENNLITYLVTISVDNSENLLRPMMTANVDIVTEALQDVLHLPLEAVRLENGEDVVDLLSTGIRVRRKVRIGLRTESEAVIAHGLQEGDQVILPSTRKAHS